MTHNEITNKIKRLERMTRTKVRQSQISGLKRLLQSTTTGKKSIDKILTTDMNIFGEHRTRGD